MVILGIETSCDETSLAFINTYGDTSVEPVSTLTYSQVDIHAKFGGVVPEVASRNHMLKIGPMFTDILNDTGIKAQDIDAVAVTNAPGLIGALFVGVSFAKGLGYALDIPVIPVHHLSGHILSAEISNPSLRPPYLALVISGGHTHIYTVTEPLSFSLHSRTIDDAAGEAFDKVAKMLGGVYPGGPFIETLASGGDPFAVKFPVAIKDSDNFSFSGLKTAVLNSISRADASKADIAASFQHTVAQTLTEKTFRIADRLGFKNIVVTGGVACNSVIRRIFSESAGNRNVFFPEKKLCNDNALMIAYAAWRLSAGKDLSQYKRLDFPAGDTMHEINV